MANRPRVSEQPLSDFLDAGGRRGRITHDGGGRTDSDRGGSARHAFSAVGIEVHVEGAVGQRRELVHPRPVLEVAESGFIDEQVAGVRNVRHLISSLNIGRNGDSGAPNNQRTRTSVTNGTHATHSSVARTREDR
jgi:hypothetical protein